MKKNDKKNKNGIFIVVLLVFVVILMLFFPKIYNYIESLKLPKIENKVENKEEVDRKIDEDIIETIHYPLMRNSVYNSNTYYSLDKFTINDMSNGDILLNAFLDIYEGNMTSSGSTGSCTTVSKQFNKEWIELRIKNILGKNVKYKLENFNVPEDSNSKYKGTWKYDSKNLKYTYDGLCKSQATNTKYYDLTKLIKLEYANEDSNDINAYYYVGFAKVVGNSYSIYSDSQMKNEIHTGTLNNTDELNTIFEGIDKSNLKIYKYTFKDNLCSYNEYCLYQGEWVNEF